MLRKPPLVLDNTIVSTFGKSGQFILLESLYSGSAIIPTEVISEAIAIPALEAQIKKAIGDGWLTEHNINYVDHPDQLKLYAQLRRRFGNGESAVMAVAKVTGCTVGSDDMSATVKYCKTNAIPLMGSLGVLYHAFSETLIDENVGNSILTDMKSKGYICPARSFTEIRDWFENKKGRELF